MSDLSWESRSEGDATTIVLAGSITEASDFGALLDQPPGTYTLDLAEISRINSSGVREWIRFIRAFTENRSVSLVRCAVGFVQQLNMISNMAGGSKIVSVMLPYFCSSCDDERSHLLELASGGAEIHDELACPKCGGSMEFDDLKDSYLSFVRA